MKFFSKFVSAMVPSWRTLDEWIYQYIRIIEDRGYSPQTVKNRRICVMHISKALGTLSLRTIRPNHIAGMLRSFLPDRASTGQRVLGELREMLTEAVQHGWINVNYATYVRRPAARVKRQRLSMDNWIAMREVAAAGTVRWVEPMLVLALITGQRRGDLRKMRFDDVWDDHLHIEQEKKAGKARGARVAIPLSLRLDAIDMTVGDVIEVCRHYAKPGPTLLRKRNGEMFQRPEMLSYRFEKTINQIGAWPPGARPSLHECRSLSERVFRKQGIDTQRLLGHKSQIMTDKYNDDRGLNDGEWKHVEIAA